jgi:alpha-ketoglutaric semialdehyde dehydrogenase
LLVFFKTKHSAMPFRESTSEEINQVMEASKQAFEEYCKTPPDKRASFLDAIANEMEALGDQLILTASQETNLPATRLLSERGRTTGQLRTFAMMLREGSWVEASIDTAEPSRQPLPKPDLRKMLFPLGPVLVFGASNFPFAYSTAGGDTASALAAGCTVVVKAHQAHAETSEMVSGAIKKAAKSLSLPEGVFLHVHGASPETGKALVQHPATAAVGFTGSFTGGRALYDYAHQRKVPIPVFSEMGSVNPVVFLPHTLEENLDQLVQHFSGSVTTGMGQFCTKPGLMFMLQGESADRFEKLLSASVKEVKAAKMLHPGIFKSFVQNAGKVFGALGEESSVLTSEEDLPAPSIATVSGKRFLENKTLHEEVFGPFSLIIKCKDIRELKEAWLAVSGQLTTSIIATDEDLRENRDLISAAMRIAGRVVFNGVPTGVEVCASMVHGGPYPATTDSRYTAVGVNAVKRWVRPVCFQNCPHDLLPDELKNSNPLGILRQVNNEWTRQPLN